MGEPAAFIRIMRPVNCLMVGFAILVGGVIGGGMEFLGSATTLFLSFITGFTLTGSAMAINDYYDREIDAINEPGRPIPSGAVSPQEALALTLVLSSVGLGAAWMTGLSNLALAALAWLLMMAYSTSGKRMGFPGNLMVSSCISLPFVYGGAMAGGAVLGSSFIFALLAFLTNTGREVTKGIVDIEGDRANGINTVAVSRGAVFASWVSVVLYLSAVVVSILPVYLERVSFWYTPFVAFTDLGLIYVSFRLAKEPGRENSRWVKNKVRIFMLSGLLGFLLGNLL
jgi:geranylgeranylglycerol-phosphate geranylgeranyltransferase